MKNQTSFPIKWSKSIMAAQKVSGNFWMRENKITVWWVVALMDKENKAN